MQQTQFKKGRLGEKTILTLSLISILLCGGFRTYQLFANIEPHTGFFKAENWNVYVMYALVLAGMLLLGITMAVSKRIPASRPVFRKSKGLLLTGILFAIGLAADAAFALIQIIKAFQNISFSTQALSKLLFTDGYLSVILCMICAIFACIYFLLIALSYANEKATYCDYKLLALSPLFWAMFRLVRRFMTKISFLEVSELVFELALLAFMALFFLSFARVSSQISQKGEMKKVMCYGVIAAFLALFLSLSRLICTIGGRQELLADGFGFSLADFGFGVFTLTYIFEHLRYGRPVSEDDSIPMEEEIKEEEMKEAKEKDSDLDDHFLDDVMDQIEE